MQYTITSVSPVHLNIPLIRDLETKAVTLFHLKKKSTITVEDWQITDTTRTLKGIRITPVSIPKLEVMQEAETQSGINTEAIDDLEEHITEKTKKRRS